MNLQFDEMPPAVRDFLVYNEAVAGKSAATVQEYFLDLQTFLRYMKRTRGMVAADTPDEHIPISDLDDDFFRSVTLNDLYNFVIYCKNQRGNNAKTRCV